MSALADGREMSVPWQQSWGHVLLKVSLVTSSCSSDDPGSFPLQLVCLFCLGGGDVTAVSWSFLGRVMGPLLCSMPSKMQCNACVIARGTTS